MNIQNGIQYRATMSAAYIGQQADMTSADVVSATLVGEREARFGELLRYVYQDTPTPSVVNTTRGQLVAVAGQIPAGYTAGANAGIALMDRGARGNDAFTPRSAVRIMRKGRIFVALDEGDVGLTGLETTGLQVQFLPDTTDAGVSKFKVLGTVGTDAIKGAIVLGGFVEGKINGQLVPAGVLEVDFIAQSVHDANPA